MIGYTILSAIFSQRRANKADKTVVRTAIIPQNKSVNRFALNPSSQPHPSQSTRIFELKNEYGINNIGYNNSGQKALNAFFIYHPPSFFRIIHYADEERYIRLTVYQHINKRPGKVNFLGFRLFYRL